MKHLALIATLLASVHAGAAILKPIKGFNLTEIGVHHYDAAERGAPKMEAQIIVDKLYALGVRHIALSPRAYMRDPKQSEVVPMTPPEDRVSERAGYLRLIEYIHSLGMTVGIRPLLFVVDDILNPYIEVGRPRPTGHVWWHGNIMPANPTAWFESWREYLNLYIPIAQRANVEEFTLGAELHSMTVGMEGYPAPYNSCGFPWEWVNVLKFVRAQLPGVRLMYDINYTDDTVHVGQILTQGGEFAQWCGRLAHPSFPLPHLPVEETGGQIPTPVLPPVLPAGTPPEEGACWAGLMTFWRGLDAVGIDFYRSLATAEYHMPESCDDTTLVLKETSDRFASQIDNCLFEIGHINGRDKELIIKDTGYRSVLRGYLDPFLYAGAGEFNACHQSASYDAIFLSFWVPRWPWFRGIVWWDASVNMDLHGAHDVGFSPLGKPQTELVLKKYFGPVQTDPTTK